MSDRLTITKLSADGSNWVTYRDRMSWHFNSRHWASHLTSSMTPQSYTNAGVINGLTPDQRWSNEEAEAMDMIALSVPDDVFNVIKDETTTMAVWNAVKDIYQNRSPMIAVDLGKKLQNSKLGNEGDARAHFTRLNSLRGQLASMGTTYTDAEYAAILLGKIPPSYAPILGGLNAVAHTSGNAITSSQVILLISDEYDRRVIQKGNNTNDEAFAANGQKRREMCNIEGFNCHRMGHIRADCRSPGGGKEGQHPPRQNNNATSNDNRGTRNQSDNRNDRSDNHNNCGRNNNCNNNRNENANTANTTAANSADIEAWAAIEEIENDDPSIPSTIPHTAFTAQDPQVEIELYDSGASRHMSPFRHRFINYRSIDPRPITAANAHTFYAIGAGDLQIDVPNGTSTTPVLLCDTLHAPDMALTIVSIGCITSTGNSVTFKQNSCRIKNKSGTTIGHIPTSSNGLYKVEHSHHAASATPIEQVDIHTLHCRLGHIPADAIRSLIRKGAIEGVQLIDDGSPIICDSCEYAKLTCKVILKEHVAPPAKCFW
jgi:hypothetical protein